MAEYFGVAKDLGIRQKEIDTIQSIVMAVAGGRVRSGFCEARGLKPPGPSRPQPGKSTTTRPRAPGSAAPRKRARTPRDTS